ncbi:hypothetical protein OBBRIDRAFT_790330 [Obba rivulosa]|uniref:Uncharacterized protein n=1 Tax=Obba rivulosa TaxID=1052685 RepID=A0A8E2DPD8_9APHY|nr:hypothetical protein OBBRIDRAFT_790330 [Obba rivulosa]
MYAVTWCSRATRNTKHPLSEPRVATTLPALHSNTPIHLATRQHQKIGSIQAYIMTPQSAIQASWGSSLESCEERLVQNYGHDLHAEDSQHYDDQQHSHKREQSKCKYRCTECGKERSSDGSIEHNTQRHPNAHSV